MIEALKGDQIQRPEARRRREGRGRRGGECVFLCPLEHTSVALSPTVAMYFYIKRGMVPGNIYRDQTGDFHPRNYNVGSVARRRKQYLQ
jgi:hypothetical protein